MGNDPNPPQSSSYGQQQYREYAQQPPPYAQPHYGYGQPQLQYVSVWPRAAATIIDWFILSLLGIPFSFIYQIFHISRSYVPGVLYLLAIILYPIVMEAMWGATLGKMMLGLRVVKTDGSPISWSQAVIRNLLRVIDGLFSYLVGAILIWDSPLRQRLGDRVAKTVVVRRQP